jgi:hypothetical protein
MPYWSPCSFCFSTGVGSDAVSRKGILEAVSTVSIVPFDHAPTI